MRFRCLAFASFAYFPATLLAAPVELVIPALRGAMQPQVAVASRGDIHVVFGEGKAVYHTSSADGRSFSAPVKVGELEKLALGERRGPRVVVSDGVVLVTAISHADGNVHTWTSPNSGKDWQEGKPLNSTDGSAREGLQALAGDGRGQVVAVWLDMRGGNMQLWGRSSRDGGKTWLADELVYASPGGAICPCCVPNVAISPQGKVAVMWRNSLEGSRDLYLSTRSGGEPFSPATKLGTGTWKLDACPMDGGNLAFSPSGDWTAVWRRDRSVFSSSANVPEAVLGHDSSQPVAVYSGDTPILLWETGSALMMKRGDAAPAKFAEGGKSASTASGKGGACVVWEGRTAEGKTLLFECLP